MDPTDEPLLTDADRARLLVIEAADPLARAELLRAYYSDPDRLCRTPRLIMNGHLLTLAGTVVGLGQTLIDPANDDGLTDADRERLRRIAAEDDPALLARFINDYWQDIDRAARTNRAPLYHHCGRLARAVADLSATSATSATDRATAGIDAILADMRAHLARHGIEVGAFRLTPGGPSPPPTCGERAPTLPYYCTRARAHDGDHVAGVGPWVEGEAALARWPPLQKTTGSPDADPAAAARRPRAARMGDELGQLAPMAALWDPMTVWCVAGLVHLALKHGEVPTGVRDRGAAFLATVRRYFEGCPTVLSSLEDGEVPEDWGG